MSGKQMTRLALALAATISALPTFGLCHPHVFISARFEAVAGHDGTLQELRNDWLFDEVFSSSIMFDFDKNGDFKLDADELNAVGETVRKSMSKYGYYTSLIHDGAKIAVKKPSAIHATYTDNLLQLRFTVTPAQPVPIKGKLIFGIYDPTLYTAIDFDKDADMKIVGAAFAKCAGKVVRPNPDQIIAQNQATLTSMFFNDPTGTNFSQLTATRLEATCP
jgi:ABC-type uncharacterized transport system substrate-binding protein